MAAMKANDISELNLDIAKFKLLLKRQGSHPQVQTVSFDTIQSTNPEDPNCFSVFSPLVGVFYQSPSPDDPPFVTIGQAVKAGDTLCIIEAMKTMNEIKATQAGVLVEILGKNEQMVEHGQLLFRFKPGEFV